MDISRYTQGDCRCCSRYRTCDHETCSFRYTDRKTGRFHPSPGNPLVETQSPGLRMTLGMMDVRGLSIVGDGAHRKWKA
jgi:hypothetical protein